MRNSQATVLAPTGTIGLMMDCDTTGIEPDLALTKAKKLVGGGTMFIVNQTIPRALRNLGYSDEEIDVIVELHRRAQDDHRRARVQARAPAGVRVLDGRQHDPLHGSRPMMGAVQPFISGAISKTVNMPEEATVEEVEQLHIESWRLGLKAVAVYRDNCKVGQPLITQKKAGGRRPRRAIGRADRRDVIVQEPVRQKLPRIRTSKTFSFRVADCHGYVTVGEYEDGRPGELFLKVASRARRSPASWTRSRSR